MGDETRRDQVSIMHFNEYAMTEWYNDAMKQWQHIVIYLWTDWHTEQRLGVTCQEAVECEYKQRMLIVKITDKILQLSVLTRDSHYNNKNILPPDILELHLIFELYSMCEF